MPHSRKMNYKALFSSCHKMDSLLYGYTSLVPPWSDSEAQDLLTSVNKRGTQICMQIYGRMDLLMLIILNVPIRGTALIHYTT